MGCIDLFFLLVLRLLFVFFLREFLFWFFFRVVVCLWYIIERDVVELLWIFIKFNFSFFFLLFFWCCFIFFWYEFLFWFIFGIFIWLKCVFEIWFLVNGECDFCFLFKIVWLVMDLVFIFNKLFEFSFVIFFLFMCGEFVVFEVCMLLRIDVNFLLFLILMFIFFLVVFLLVIWFILLRY